MAPFHELRRRYRDHKRIEGVTGEHRFGDAGQALFALVFFSVWTADSLILGWTTFPNRLVPPLFRTLAGFLVLALAWILAARGLRIVFGENRPEPEVIRKDVYGLVRHPIYLGEFLVYVGFLMFSLSLASAAVACAAGAFLHAISRYEEKLLLSRFGGEYKSYMDAVPMWFPKISRVSKSS